MIDKETEIENRIIEHLEEAKSFNTCKYENYIALGLDIAISIIKTEREKRETLKVIEEPSLE